MNCWTTLQFSPSLYQFLASKIYCHRCASMRSRNGRYSVFPLNWPMASKLGSKGVSCFMNDINLLQKLLTNLYRYGLVTEQKKGAYKYFVDLGDRMEVATARTTYVDEVCRIDFFCVRFSDGSIRIEKLKSRNQKSSTVPNLVQVQQTKQKMTKSTLLASVLASSRMDIA